MSNESLVLQYLRDSSLGAVLDDRHLRDLAEISESVSEPQGGVLFKEGSAADTLWIIGEGSVALDMLVPRRHSSRVLTLGARDLLGWSALVGDGTMSATATVTADAKLVRLSADRLKDLCVSDHTLGFAVMANIARTLANRLRGTRLQLLDLYSESEPLQGRSGGAAS